MNTELFIQKGKSLVFSGYKIKPGDIHKCILKLSDLSDALYSFSICIVKNERPRKKLIIDVELAEGFNPEKYSADSYLYELIAQLKSMSTSFREYIRNVPVDSFPELYFHRFRNIYFTDTLYRIKNKYIL
ncbi:MAG TPA: hypothetical protein VNZ49_09335 [Bacteroidia bacterium]|jgi:hypothetical protein|nr:hypothetical protein [Bacteroidia bacterium]